MKNLLISVLIVLGSLNTYAKDQEQTRQRKKFKVSVQQSGQDILITNNTVRLNASSFDLVFEFSKPMSVLVNASFDSSSFVAATRNVRKDKIPGFLETGMAEENFNKGKEILMSKTAPNCWYYDSISEHRFNKVELLGDTIVCTRTIQNLFDVDASQNIEVSNNRKTLYLVFISYELNKRNESVEVQREVLRIEWE